MKKGERQCICKETDGDKRRRMKRERSIKGVGMRRRGWDLAAILAYGRFMGDGASLMGEKESAGEREGEAEK